MTMRVIIILGTVNCTEFIEIIYISGGNIHLHVFIIHALLIRYYMRITIRDVMCVRSV